MVLLPKISYPQQIQQALQSQQSTFGHQLQLNPLLEQPQQGQQRQQSHHELQNFKKPFS